MSPKISFDVALTVFLRTILAVFAGVSLAYVFVTTYAYLGLPQSDDIGLFAFPLASLGAGIGYIMFAKRTYGDSWIVGVSGILGFFASFLALFFALVTICC